MLKLICLLACIFPAFQLEDLSQTAKNYAEQLVAARRKGITELEDEITKLRKGKASKQQIAKAKEKLESLEAKDDFRTPTFDFNSIKEGQVGAFRQYERKGSRAFEIEAGFYVIEIIDADSVAVSLDGGVKMILNGVPTANLTTEGMSHFPAPFVAKSIEPYTTPGGSELKIWVFERFTEEAAAVDYAKKLLKKKK